MLTIYRFVFVFLGLLLTLSSPIASAKEAQDKGLSISPLRQEMTLKTGETKTGNFTVANLTEKPMTVNSLVKQFSTTNFVYNYEFRSPDNEWVQLWDSEVQLNPGESKKISYTVSIPDKVAPGGYYYTIFASTDISSGLPSTVQAATLLYVTVEGTLIRTSVLQDDSIPVLVTGNKIPYKFNVKNTGNVHFSAYFYGQLESLFGKNAETGTSHILMPEVTRSVEGSVPTPRFPGVYKVNYGYKVDFADFNITKSAYIIFIPPWSIAIVLFVLLGGRWLWQKRRGKPRKEK